MNKYVLKATGTFALFVISALVSGIAIRAILDYLNPTREQVVGAFIIAVFFYMAYVFIGIQADIYKRLDNLNKNK